MRKASFARRVLNLEFIGLVFTEQGFSLDPKRVEAFANTQRPTTASEVRGLLGMANYSSKFIKDYASITQPLLERMHVLHGHTNIKRLMIVNHHC